MTDRDDELKKPARKGSKRKSPISEELREMIRLELREEVRKELISEIESGLRHQRQLEEQIASGVYPPAPHLASGRLLSRVLVPGKVYERFSRNQRIQHLLLLISFTILAVTGFALMIPGDLEETTSRNLQWLFDLRGLLHRLAAIVLISTSLYHVFYLFFSTRGFHELLCMMPRLREDFKLFIGTMKYYIGRADTPPRCGRFTYGEKFEYWALVWGTIIMTVTGLALWSASHWSKFILDLCQIIHRYEAILAVLAVFFWHVYAVHLRPDVFPMSRVWWDGTMSDEELKEEHYLEWKAHRQREQAVEGRPTE
ncbi:formate dehydrogenase subunit gamma [Acidobacteriota bacterium]